MVIENTQLKTINGGEITFGIGLGIGVAIVFIIGVIDGFMRPLSCNN